MLGYALWLEVRSAPLSCSFITVNLDLVIRGLKVDFEHFVINYFVDLTLSPNRGSSRCIILSRFGGSGYPSLGCLSAYRR